jgi:hypothetical protein
VPAGSDRACLRRADGALPRLRRFGDVHGQQLHGGGGVDLGAALLRSPRELWRARDPSPPPGCSPCRESSPRARDRCVAPTVRTRTLARMASSRPTHAAVATMARPAMMPRRDRSVLGPPSEPVCPAADPYGFGRSLGFDEPSVALYPRLAGCTPTACTRPNGREVVMT